jgi:hypothetical protein
MNQRLVGGPIFGPRFVVWKWLNFTDDNGKNCFESHTRKQVVSTVTEHRTIEQNIAYAELIQGGSYD